MGYRSFKRQYRRKGHKFRRGLQIMAHQGTRAYSRVSYPRKVHFFTRTVETYYDITPSTIPNGAFFADYSVSPGASGSFKLNQLPNYTEFTTLFDQYKINGVKMTWILSSNGHAQIPYPSSNLTNSLPLLYTCIDRDDGSPHATFDEMNQIESLKVKRMDRTISRFCKPMLASSVYGGGAFSAYAAPFKNPWVDAGSTNAEYYGLKWAIDPVISTSNVINYRVKVIAKFYISCRDTR